MNKWINWKEKVSDYYYKTENSMKCKNKKLETKYKKTFNALENKYNKINKKKKKGDFQSFLFSISFAKAK